MAGLNVPASLKSGRGRVIRTPDPLVPNQVLYQAELCPATTDRLCAGENGLRQVLHRTVFIFIAP